MELIPISHPFDVAGLAYTPRVETIIFTGLHRLLRRRLTEKDLETVKLHEFFAYLYFSEMKILTKIK